MLRLSNGSEHKLHGGMGVLRLRSVAGGGADNMVDACGLRSGDVFIDATAGPLSHALAAAQTRALTLTLTLTLALTRSALRRAGGRAGGGQPGARARHRGGW